MLISKNFPTIEKTSARELKSTEPLKWETTTVSTPFESHTKADLWQKY